MFINNVVNNRLCSMSSFSHQSMPICVYLNEIAFIYFSISSLTNVLEHKIYLCDNLTKISHFIVS